MTTSRNQRYRGARTSAGYAAVNSEAESPRHNGRKRSGAYATPYSRMFILVVATVALAIAVVMFAPVASIFGGICKFPGCGYILVITNFYNH